MKERKKEAVKYFLCLVISIMMWIGQKYNKYLEEQQQIKKICQIEKKAQEKLVSIEETKTTKTTKKINEKTEKKISEQKLSDTTEAVNDTVKSINDTIITTVTQ